MDRDGKGDLAALTIGTVVALVTRPVMWIIYASFVGNAVLVAIVARVMTPFLIAPSRAVIVSLTTFITEHAFVLRVGSAPSRRRSSAAGSCSTRS